MKIYRKIFSICFLGLGCLFASQGAVADNVPIDRKITGIRTYDTWVAIKFEPSYANNLSCNSPSAAKFKYAVIDWKSDPSKKVMYATVLAAYMSGNKVGFGIIGCWSKFGGGVPLVYRVDIAPDVAP